jgi:hypothetical protein
MCGAPSLIRMTFRRVLPCVSAFVLAATVATGNIAYAQGFTPEQTGLPLAAQTAGYDVNQPCAAPGAAAAGGCIPQVIGQIVNAMLGILGALFLVLIMYGGAQYMLAGGDSKKVESAKQTITNAILGMLVVAASYAIATFVVNTVSGVTGGSQGASQVTPSP